MKLSLLLALIPLALAGGDRDGGHGGHGPRPHCPTKTVEVCAEETKTSWGKPTWTTVTVADPQCTGTTITEVTTTKTKTHWKDCEKPTRTKEQCVATQIVCEPHPKRAVPDAMSNAERLRRGLPIRSPRSFDGNGGRPDNNGQNKDKHDGEHDNGRGPQDKDREDKDDNKSPKDHGKQRGGGKHDGWHGDASCVPTTTTVTTSTKTHHVPTRHTLTRTTSTCAGPTETPKDCKTKTVDAPPVTKTKECKRGERGEDFVFWVTHEYTQTNTEYGARCTPRVHRD